MANEVRIRASVKDDASKPLGSLHDAWKRFQTDGSKGIAIGASAAVTAKSLSLLESAVGAVGNVLGDAKDAAIAEEQSIAKLDAALRANVAGWNGNRDAIEGVVKSRMALGFSDDEQRDSLALLVAATKDQTQALTLQRTAMDLARLKGIDLKTASEALIKVEAGQFRLLKSLGIELRDGATATEALAAVQKVATGQAEAFAETNGGKLLNSQVRVGEAMERIGQKILPGFVVATEAAASGVEKLVDVLDELKPATDLVGGAIGFAVDGLEGWAQAIGFVVDQEAELLAGGPAVYRRLEYTGKSALGMGDAIGEAAVSIAESAGGIGGSLTGIGTKADKAADKVGTAMSDIVTAVQDARDGLEGAASDAADALYDPIIAKGELAVTEREIAEQKQIIAAKNSTKEQIADAKLRLAELNKDKIKRLAELASYGDSSAKKTLTTMISVLESTANLSEEQREELRLLRLALGATGLAYDRLRAKAAGWVSSGKQEDDRALPGRASGGPVTAGRAYIVGESRPEVFVPDTNGTILPSVPSAPSGGGGMGGITFAPTVVVQGGLTTPAVKEQIVRELGPLFATWLRQNGIAVGRG